MSTFSHKKVSILGLILLTASAVTAAIMPKGKTDKQTEGYSLSMSMGGNCDIDQLTCSSTVGANSNQECNYTEGSNTSEDFDTSLTSPGGAHTYPGAIGSTGQGQNTSASPC